MRLLIGGSTSKFYKLTEFGNALQTIGHEYKLVEDIEYSKGFPSKNTSDWFGTKEKFKKLVSDFSPDAILIDRNSYFGLDAIKSKIPLFILLRGNYWLEKEISKKTINSGFTHHLDARKVNLFDEPRVTPDGSDAVLKLGYDTKLCGMHSTIIKLNLCTNFNHFYVLSQFLYTC